MKKFQVVNYKIKEGEHLPYPTITRIQHGALYDWGEKGSVEIWGEIEDGQEGIIICAFLLDFPGYEFERSR